MNRPLMERLSISAAAAGLPLTIWPILPWPLLTIPAPTIQLSMLRNDRAINGELRPTLSEPVRSWAGSHESRLNKVWPRPFGGRPRNTETTYKRNSHSQLPRVRFQAPIDDMKLLLATDFFDRTNVAGVEGIE